MSNKRPIVNAEFSGTLGFPGATFDDGGEVREALALQDRNGMTPLVHRQLEGGNYVRAMILGDSIAAGILLATGVGALRLFQAYVGDSGGGGVSISSGFMQLDGSAAFSSTNWFREFASVPSSSSVEYSGLSRTRITADSARVQWRAPVGGTATFKIQTCTDADGVGVGTWVDQGGTRTAESSGASEEVGTATVSLTSGPFRLRVLVLSGTVDVFGMELSNTAEGGCSIINFAADGTAFETWGALSATQRSTLIAAVDPHVVIVCYKDTPESIDAGLTALQTTLASTLQSGYPRDVVILASYPTVHDNDPRNGTDCDEVYEQREVMRAWAAENRAAFIDLWDLSPVYDIFFSDDVHLASAFEHAHMGHLIMDRLGWLRYRPAAQKYFRIGTNTTHGVAFGTGSTGATYGAALGYSADGSDYGASVGRDSDGSYYGAAVGYAADGNDQGAAVGFSAVGSTLGVAIGRQADGSTHGVAVGNTAKGLSYGVAVGEGANGNGGGVAIGHGFDARGPSSADRCRGEIGIRTVAGGGSPAARISMQVDGRCQFTAPQTDTVCTDSGGAGFQNADGTLPRGMFEWQVNAAGTALLLTVNVGGTIKTASIAIS